jgi:predicted kinase
VVVPISTSEGWNMVYSGSGQEVFIRQHFVDMDALQVPAVRQRHGGQLGGVSARVM